MKQVFKKIFFVILGSALLAPVAVMAQKDKDKGKDKKGADQIIITRKGNADDKMVIEIDGDKVTVNGKPVEDNGDVTVRHNKIKDIWAFDGNGFSGNWNNNFALSGMDEDRAMLGVMTEKDSRGAGIQSVSNESAAEKAGLKKGDVITKVDDKKIEDPDDLSSAIKAHKPGDKVTIYYLRDGKEQKATAELGKWKGVRVFAPGQGYKINIPDLNFEHLPGMESLPRMQGQAWNWSDGSRKLGISVQDQEDGKGVKVIDVDEDGNAYKAGIRENDVVTEVEGQTVNSADEVARLVRQGRDKSSLKMKLLRNGKTENIEVKIPRKLRTADL